MELTPIEGQSTIVDPNEIEASMLADVNKATFDMVQSVQRAYQLSLAAFKSKQHLLKSGRSKIRLLNMLMEYPLDTGNLKLQNDDEKEVFLAAHQALESKFLLLMYSYYSGMDKMLEQVEQPTVTEAVTTTEGENNG